MRPDSGTNNAPITAGGGDEPLVLVVDDQAPTRNMLAIALEGMGFRPLTAASAEAALETLEYTRPALIISDIRLPGMDGLEFLSHVRSSGASDAPMMLVSAYGRPRCHQADAFLAKPFRLEALESAVESLTGRAG
jgi:two-component system response regulator GlrR